MLKRAFIFVIIIFLILLGLLYLFPCEAKVESVKVHDLTNDTERLNFWLKKGKWNFNPQKKYLILFYTVSVRPLLPFSFQFGKETFKQLRDDFSVIILEPAIPRQEQWGPFKKRYIYFGIVVESPKDMSSRTIINNIELKLHAQREVKNPEWEKHPARTTYSFSQPSWPTIKVNVPKNLTIEVN